MVRNGSRPPRGAASGLATGSHGLIIPGLAVAFPSLGCDGQADAGVAQLAEHNVANVVVVGSNPITRSFFVFSRTVGRSCTSMENPETEAASEPQEEPKPKLSLEVSVSELGTCKRHVTVSIARPDIDRYFQEAFDEFQPKAEVPGFRPGRAPRKLVESRFREQVANQVKGSLLMDSVSQINEEATFSAISEPDLDFEAVELPDEGPMTFEFDIEVRPEFELPQWKGLQLSRPTHEYTDAEVDAHLRKLLARYGRLVEKDGPAEAGDHVTLNIRFYDGETVVSEISAETVEIQAQAQFPRCDDRWIRHVGVWRRGRRPASGQDQGQCGGRGRGMCAARNWMPSWK